MPYLPGDSLPDRPPGTVWKLFDRGLLKQSEVVFTFLDELGDDDITAGVNNLSEIHREILPSFLRSLSIEEFPPGFFIGPGVTPEVEREWQLYRQKKAHVILSSFASEDLTGKD